MKSWREIKIENAFTLHFFNLENKDEGWKVGEKWKSNEKKKLKKWSKHIFKFWKYAKMIPKPFDF